MCPTKAHLQRTVHWAGPAQLELVRTSRGGVVIKPQNRPKVRLNRGAQSPCQALMELLHYQMRQVNVSLKRSEVCLNRVRRAQVTPSWSSSDYQERSVSQSEKRSKVRLN